MALGLIVVVATATISLRFPNVAKKFVRSADAQLSRPTSTLAAGCRYRLVTVCDLLTECDEDAFEDPVPRLEGTSRGAHGLGGAPEEVSRGVSRTIRAGVGCCGGEDADFLVCMVVESDMSPGAKFVTARF